MCWQDLQAKVVAAERRLRRCKRVRWAPATTKDDAGSIDRWTVPGLDCAARPPDYDYVPHSRGAAHRSQRRSQARVFNKSLGGLRGLHKVQSIVKVRRRARPRHLWEALVRLEGTDDDGLQLYDDSWEPVNKVQFPDTTGELSAAAIAKRGYDEEMPVLFMTREYS